MILTGLKKQNKNGFTCSDLGNELEYVTFTAEDSQCCTNREPLSIFPKLCPLLNFIFHSLIHEMEGIPVSV